MIHLRSVRPASLPGAPRHRSSRPPNARAPPRLPKCDWRTGAHPAAGNSSHTRHGVRTGARPAGRRRCALGRLGCRVQHQGGGCRAGGRHGHAGAYAEAGRERVARLRACVVGADVRCRRGAAVTWLRVARRARFEGGGRARCYRRVCGGRREEESRRCRGDQTVHHACS